jgi:hypothetical protein
MNRAGTLLILSLISITNLFSQNRGVLSGSIQSTTQYYFHEEEQFAGESFKKWGSNNYLKLNYSIGSFTAGLQYETYFSPLSGYPYQLKGSGLTEKFIRYSKQRFDITAGSYFEQFGNGLIFRAYESRELGINTSLEGLRAIIYPLKSLKVTGVLGKQREFLKVSNNLIKGVDLEYSLEPLSKSGIGLIFGLGYVNKYEKYSGTEQNIPLSVNATSFRISFSDRNFNLTTEYAGKSSDPTIGNNYENVRGSALLINSSWFKEGLGLFFSFRYLDNMEFRNRRESEGVYGQINYLPSNTKQHSYLLPNIYPYATQNCEISAQGEATFKVKKTDIKLNLSHVRSTQTKNVLFQDFNIEVRTKLNPKLKSVFTYVNILYDKAALEAPIYDFVKSNILIADLHYRMTNLISVNTQIQHLWTRQDHGNWAAALLQIGFAPHWRVYLSEMTDYNYAQREDYMNAGVGYNSKFGDISIGYGKQKEGLVCAGGVCRRVPAYKGFEIKFNMNF